MVQVKFQPHRFFEDQVVRVFPGEFGAHAVACERRGLVAGDPEARMGAAGFGVLDFGVDFAPARVGVDAEILAAPIEGPGNNGANLVTVYRDEAVAREFG